MSANFEREWIAPNMSDAQVDPPAEARQQAVRAFKKSVILDAAQRVLDRAGIDGATVRAIAKEAGYTPGALYAYYAGKDDVLAELLCQSLGRTARAVRQAAENAARSADDPLVLAAAFSNYYRQEVAEFDLLLSVLQSHRIGNLSPEMGRTLNGRLIAALAPIAEALESTGRWDTARASEATIQAAALGLGVVLFENSGRLSALGMDGRSLTSSGLTTLFG